MTPDTSLIVIAHRIMCALHALSALALMSTHSVHTTATQLPATDGLDWTIPQRLTKGITSIAGAHLSGSATNTYISIRHRRHMSTVRQIGSQDGGCARARWKSARLRGSQPTTHEPFVQLHRCFLPQMLHETELTYGLPSSLQHVSPIWQVSYL